MLSRLLSLLSNFFNLTLGEKLLEHLRRWTDPETLNKAKTFKPGDEVKIPCGESREMQTSCLAPAHKRMRLHASKCRPPLRPTWCLKAERSNPSRGSDPKPLPPAAARPRQVPRPASHRHDGARGVHAWLHCRGPLLVALPRGAALVQ